MKATLCLFRASLARAPSSGGPVGAWHSCHVISLPATGRLRDTMKSWWPITLLFALAVYEVWLWSRVGGTSGLRRRACSASKRTAGARRSHSSCRSACGRATSGSCVRLSSALGRDIWPVTRHGGDACMAANNYCSPSTLGSHMYIRWSDTVRSFERRLSPEQGACSP